MLVRTESLQAPQVDRTEYVDHSIRLELVMIASVLAMGILAAVAIVIPAVVSS